MPADSPPVAAPGNAPPSEKRCETSDTILELFAATCAVLNVRHPILEWPSMWLAQANQLPDLVIRAEEELCPLIPHLHRFRQAQLIECELAAASSGHELVVAVARKVEERLLVAVLRRRASEIRPERAELVRKASDQHLRERMSIEDVAGPIDPSSLRRPTLGNYGVADEDVPFVIEIMRPLRELGDLSRSRILAALEQEARELTLLQEVSQSSAGRAPIPLTRPSKYDAACKEFECWIVENPRGSKTKSAYLKEFLKPRCRKLQLLGKGAIKNFRSALEHRNLDY